MVGSSQNIKSPLCRRVCYVYLLFLVLFTEINWSHGEKLAGRFMPVAGLPDLDECGKQSFITKVYNGEVRAIGVFPWIALLEYRQVNPISRSTFICGGSLITNRYVLTAAHCASGEEERLVGGLVNVRLGEHNIDTDIECNSVHPTDCVDPPINFAIEKIILHPEYQEDISVPLNDIALLQLAETVTYSDFVRPICLSSALPATVYEPGNAYYVARWTKTDTKSLNLLKIKLLIPIVEESECARIYKLYGVTLYKGAICTAGDICSGDSGGPLMAQSSSSAHWYIIGLLSVEPTPCRIVGVPNIFTKVNDYMGWILQNIM